MKFIREGKLDLDPLLEEARRLLDVVIRSSRLALGYKVQRSEEGGASQVQFVFSGPDENLLLAHNADLMQAIEYLLVRCLHLPPQFHEQVRLDCAGYRAQRLEELKMTARVAADRVRESHQPFQLNPMSSRERRIVHLALAEDPTVRTSSEGDGDRRHIVIYPVDTKK
jgi:spoIIIJ-associated protein